MATTSEVKSGLDAIGKRIAESAGLEAQWAGNVNQAGEWLFRREVTK